MVALQSLRRPEDVARIRGKQISDVLPFKNAPAAEAEEAVAAVTVVVEEKPVLVEEPAPEPVAEEPVAAEPEPVAAEPEPVAEPTAEAPAAEEKPKRRSLRKKKDDK
jgi:hypothetical protein